MGPALCLLSAACFGALGIFGKFAYAAGVTPATALLVRFTLAAAILAVLLVRRRPAAPPRRAVLLALGLGAVGYATQASLYFAALAVMDASLLSLMLYTYPALVLVGAVLLGRERLTRRRAAALVAASAGTVLVLLGAGGGGLNPLGALLGLGAAATYTAYILVADTVVHDLPPLTLTTLVMTGAAAALAGRALVTGGVDLAFHPAGWAWLAAIALVSTVLAALAFFAGLRRTGPSTAAILSTFEPLVTTALAALALGESPTPAQLAGGGLVLGAVVALQARRPAREPRPRASGPRNDRAGGSLARQCSGGRS